MLGSKQMHLEFIKIKIDSFNFILFILYMH